MCLADLSVALAVAVEERRDELEGLRVFQNVAVLAVLDLNVEVPITSLKVKWPSLCEPIEEVVEVQATEAADLEIVLVLGVGAVFVLVVPDSVLPAEAVDWMDPVVTTDVTDSEDVVMIIDVVVSSRIAVVVDAIVPLTVPCHSVDLRLVREEDWTGEKESRKVIVPVEERLSVIGLMLGFMERIV